MHPAGSILLRGRIRACGGGGGSPLQWVPCVVCSWYQWAPHSAQTSSHCPGSALLGQRETETETEADRDHEHVQKRGENMILCFHEGKEVVLVMREFMMMEEALVFTTTGDLVGALLKLLRRLVQAPPLSSSWGRSEHHIFSLLISRACMCYERQKGPNDASVGCMGLFRPGPGYVHMRPHGGRIFFC